MMTQEEYMDLLALRRQGNTIGEIAEKLGYHPATISKWLRDGAAAGEDDRPGGQGDRRCVGGADRAVDRPAGGEAVGVEPVRDHHDGGVYRFVPFGGPPSA